MIDIAGIFVPLVTPFTDDDHLDLPRWRRHIESLIRGGVHGVIAGASTGEGLSLSPGEFEEIVTSAVNTAAGRIPVFAGCTSYSTRQVINKINGAEAMGASGAMITHPYYALPDEAELRAHYRAVSEAVRIPVIVYNNPATTGVDASPELLAEITEYAHLEAIKESSGDCTRIPRIRQLTGDRVPILCGSDHQALEHMSAGAAGWVAGVGNIIPEQCVALYQMMKECQLLRARKLYDLMYPLLAESELSGKYVQVNKLGLELRGDPAGMPRRPLLPLDASGRERVKKALEVALSAT